MLVTVALNHIPMIFFFLFAKMYLELSIGAFGKDAHVSVCINEFCCFNCPLLPEQYLTQGLK